MQAVSAPEDLQVAGPEVQRVHPLTITREDPGDAVEPFVVGAADAWVVLELAALVGLLYEHGDGEIVGVEVPGEELTRVEDVGRQAGQRIGIAVQFGDLETVSEEPGEFRGSEHRVGGAARLPRVARDEAARAFQERVDRVIGREVVVEFGVEVGVHHLGREVGGVLPGEDLVVEEGDRRGPDQVLDDRAADGAEPLTGGVDGEGVGRGPGLVQRIAVEVDDGAEGVHWSSVTHPVHGENAILCHLVMTEIDAERVTSQRGLRAAVAVADAGSFTGAAHGLGIGQSAVSHAVARLEQSLGVELFERRRDGVVPTDVGAVFVSRVGSALREIDAAVATAATAPSDGSVTISVSTSLATYWLTPRLPGFKREHPGIELRVLTTDTDREVGRDGADLWIPLGPIDDPALEPVPFCAERVIPVASPDLAATLPDRDPAALRRAPLLHLEERYTSRYDWPRWFRHHGVDVDEVAGDRSNDYSLVLHAALAGTGVALGWEHIVRELLAEGRLVEVGPPVETGVQFPLLVAASGEWRVLAAQGATQGTANKIVATLEEAGYAADVTHAGNDYQVVLNNFTSVNDAATVAIAIRELPAISRPRVVRR